MFAGSDTLYTQLLSPRLRRIAANTTELYKFNRTRSSATAEIARDAYVGAHSLSL